MKRFFYEIWVCLAAAIAAELKPRSWLDLPLETRLIVSSNAISRLL
jgi:hypothetical protein